MSRGHSDDYLPLIDTVGHSDVGHWRRSSSLSPPSYLAEEPPARVWGSRWETFGLPARGTGAQWGPRVYTEQDREVSPQERPVHGSGKTPG